MTLPLMINTVQAARITHFTMMIDPRLRTRLFLRASAMKFVCIAVIAGAVMLPATGAQARPEYWAAIQQIYHPKLGSALAKQQCMTCHTSGFEDDPGQQQRYLNAYGKDFQKQATRDRIAFISVENMDSDQDGWPNGVELRHATLPGDPRYHPDGYRLPNTSHLPTTSGSPARVGTHSASGPVTMSGPFGRAQTIVISLLVFLTLLMSAVCYLCWKTHEIARQVWINHHSSHRPHSEPVQPSSGPDVLGKVRGPHENPHAAVPAASRMVMGALFEGNICLADLEESLVAMYSIHGDRITIIGPQDLRPGRTSQRRERRLPYYTGALDPAESYPCENISATSTFAPESRLVICTEGVSELLGKQHTVNPLSAGSAGLAPLVESLLHACHRSDSKKNEFVIVGRKPVQINISK